MSALTPHQDCLRAALPELAAAAESCILRRRYLTPTGMQIEMRRFTGKKASPLIVYQADHNPTQEERFAASGGRRNRIRGHTTCRYDLGRIFGTTPAAVQAKLKRLQVWDESKADWGGTVTCRPCGFDHKLKVSDEAIDVVEKDYCPQKLAEIERNTGIRYRKLRKIGGRKASAADDAVPSRRLWGHAVDETFEKDGSREKLAHLTHVAKDTEIGTVYLQLLGPWKEPAPEETDDDAKGAKKAARVPTTREDWIEDLAVMLARPQPVGSHLRVALDGHFGLNGLVDMALEKARQLRPDLPPGERVLDPWHVKLNLSKPAEEFIAESRKSLPPGDESEVLRYLLSAAENYLLKAPWHPTAEKASALWMLTALFERLPELEEIFWTIVLFYDVQAAPDRATAQQRYAYWCAGLSEDMKALFKGFLAYLKQRHDAFFAYFAAKDDTRALGGTAISLTSSPCESYHRLVKRCKRDAPSSSLELLHEKMSCGYGVLAKAEEAKLTELWKRDWEHRKRLSAAKKQHQAAKSNESEGVAVAA